MFQDETFREAVVNNLKFVVLGSLFQLCAGLIWRFCLHIFPRVEIFCGLFILFHVSFHLWRSARFFPKCFLSSPRVWFCYVMEKLGMEPIALLANSHTALITITLIDGYKYCGLYMIIFIPHLYPYQRM